MNGPNERHLQFIIIEVAGRLETFQASRTTSFDEDMGKGKTGANTRHNTRQEETRWDVGPSIDVTQSK